MSQRWSEEGRFLSGEDQAPSKPKRTRQPKSQGRFNPNLSTQIPTEPVERTEGAWCRTCGVKYTGSMTEHFKGHK